MNHSLQEMVDAFERTSLDERVFLILSSSEELDVCVEFNRQDQLRCWSLFFRDAPTESLQKCSRLHVAEVARAFKLSERTLAHELAKHLLTQAAFADQFVREIRDLLGEPAVRESIVQTQLFMDALKDAVSSALGEEHSQPTGKEDQPSAGDTPALPAKTEPKLRVIRD
jgi:hypothetical protein